MNFKNIRVGFFWPRNNLGFIVSTKMANDTESLRESEDLCLFCLFFKNSNLFFIGMLTVSMQ